MIDASRISEFLSYFPDTGIFTWKVDSPRKQIGSIAGHSRKDGYIRIQLLGKPYLAHRLAWAIINDYWPNKQIDHINGNRSDNRILNLREASNSENAQNKRKTKSASSKYIGVSWSKVAKKWHSRIMIDGIQHHLGYFESDLDAFNAYSQAKKAIHAFNPEIK